jgi:hypothetical protein
MGIVSYLGLFWDMRRNNKTQPLATRLAVSFALILSFFSTLRTNGQAGDLAVTGVYAALSLLLVLFTLPRQKNWCLTRFHQWCVAISLAGCVQLILGTWPIISLVLAIMADIIAYVPTIHASWTDPWSQPQLTYLIALWSALLALAANLVQDEELTKGSAFTVYLILIDAILPLIISYRKRVVVEQPQQPAAAV